MRRATALGKEETAMRRHMVVAAIIFLLALLASSVAWAHGSRHGFSGHGFRHHGSSNHGFQHHGPSNHGFRQHGFSHHGHGHHKHGHHPRSRADIIIAPPVIQSWYYRSPPYTIYSYPPIVAAPASPPIYIEQGSVLAPAEQPATFWHYCNNPQGYYPQVKECPSGWQAVPAGPTVDR